MGQLDDKKTGISDRQRNGVRAAIYPMAGFYLIYNAYCMYKEISVTSGNEQILMIVFSILFAIVGLGMILLGFSIGYKHSKKIKEEQNEQQTEL